MQRSVLDRATIEVADNQDMSDWDTANETNRDLRTGKERSFWRIASFTFLWSLTVAGLVFALAPTSARAAAGGVPAEIAALQTQVAELQSIVHTLQDQVSALQASNTALQKQLAAVQSNKALLLGPFVNVDPNPENGVIGPNIKFTGANIHILSGSNATDDNGNRTGLGNLIIGYDEVLVGRGEPPLAPGDRGGSHNLVIGIGNRFTKAAFGGIVAGAGNTIQNSTASVTGGRDNIASGFQSSVTGGQGNIASGGISSVSGGVRNIASGSVASVSGGSGNTASGGEASVSGGQGNTASGFWASVSGGERNTASGRVASVSGGESNTAGGGGSVSGGEGNIASGPLASISGGVSNTAGGVHTVVIGGEAIIDNKNNSIAPQPPFP